MAAQDAAETVEFSWAGETFSMPKPKGYCFPQGEQQIAESEAFAASDPDNALLTDLHLCGAYSVVSIHVATPRNTPAINLPRSELTRLVGQQVSDAMVNEAFDEVEEEVAENDGRDLNMDSRDFGPAGYDEDCAYIAGAVDIASDGTSQTKRMSICMTLVGTRLLAVYVIDGRSDGESVEALRARSRAVARSISLQ
ncbi:MAG: hypothetical protein AAF697_09450 [Pseudomonadota bacterium]